MRLLVVEDEPRMAAMLRRGLQEEGYRVDVCPDGGSVLRKVADNGYDALVLDLGLPGMDGVAVCEALRRTGRWLPVLMLTARGGFEDRVRGLDAGADDYLVKPFSFGELTARLRALLRRAPAEETEPLVLADLRLDRQGHQVWRGSTEITLSRQEFALLEVLMRHPGQVLTRTRLLEHAWDLGYDPGSNVVDQYVGYLRRKVDRPFGLRQIDTVRGVGYRLRAVPQHDPDARHDPSADAAAHDRSAAAG